METFIKYLDLENTFIPFAVQCTDPVGTKTSPTVDNLVVYLEDGADVNPIVAGSEIGNSPFDPVQLPTDAGKTGFWGLNIAKSNFAAGNHYHFIWEMTIDGKASAKHELYKFYNSASVKSDVSALATEANATANAAAVIVEVEAAETAIIAHVTANTADIIELIRYSLGEKACNVAAVAVPARLVEVGMLDTIDISISPIQVLHVELTYNSNKDVVSTAFTVV